tara:strand:- start:1417 stop:1938 length:522 start_codon:yes stop_codon:yes gene_type:complete
MTELNQPLLDGPISGQHMVSELGGRPWQQAPQYTTVDEAIEYYLDRMSSEEFTDQLVDVLEMDVPVTTLANTIQLGSVMDGKHSVDIGMLVMPLLMEMIMLVGDMADVKYDSGMESPKKGKTRDTLLESVRTKLQREIDAKEGMIFSEDEIKEDVPKADAEDEEPKGLMARRV